MKTSKYLAIITGVFVILSGDVKAQEGCDGPVFWPGSTTGTCACVPLGGCGSPSVTTMNDYYSCGGNTTATCNSKIDKVGGTQTCTTTFDSAAYQVAINAWELCPFFCGPRPTVCTFTLCTLSTPPTPIMASVHTGSDGTCPYAYNDRLPSKQRLVFLLSLQPTS